MLQIFEPGDFLVFQLESGFGLLRVLGVEDIDADPIWHVAVFDDLFLDVDMADAALLHPESLKISLPHVALTNRAFESTQVAKMKNVPLTTEDLAAFKDWAQSGREVHDRSIRLMMGLR